MQGRAFKKTTTAATGEPIHPIFKMTIVYNKLSRKSSKWENVRGSWATHWVPLNERVFQ